MTTLKCLDCGNVARWNVWYKDFSSPDFLPSNIAYNTLCDNHAAYELINGRNGYAVEQMTLVSDSFLPKDDRALAHHS